MALSLVLVLALVAMAVDYGYFTCARTELQNAADAAALAGASQLLDRDELTGKPNQADEIAQARTQARRLALANQAAGVSLDLGANSSNDPNGELVAGYVANPGDLSSPMVFNTGTPPTQFSTPLLFLPPVTTPAIPFINPPDTTSNYHSYNSVAVKTQRTSARNGPVGAFFGKALGVNAVGLSATATATYEDNIKGFRIGPNGPATCKLLPFALDVNTFGAVAAGNSVLDLYRYNPNGPATPPVYPGPPPVPGDYSKRVTFAVPPIDPNQLSPLLNLNSPQLSPVIPYAGSVTGFAVNLLFNPPDLFDPTKAVGTIFPGDGVKEGLMVPLAIQARLPTGAVSLGNFASLYIGTGPNTPLTEFQRQILYGPNAADLAALGYPLMLGADGTLTMKGDTLVNSSLKQVLGQIKGQPRVLPLFRATPQKLLPQILGRQVDLEIVGFAGVILLEVIDIPATPPLMGIQNPLTGQWIAQPFPGTPASLRLLFQPEFVIDATAVGGGNNSSRFVYRPLRLSR